MLRLGSKLAEGGIISSAAIVLCTQLDCSDNATHGMSCLLLFIKSPKKGEFALLVNNKEAK